MLPRFKILSIAVAVLLPALILGFSSYLAAQSAASGSGLSACPSCSVDFAIYAPVGKESGVWRFEAEALTSMFKKFGWSYEIVDADAIRAGYLGSGAQRRFRGLVMPGGYVLPRLSQIGAQGKTAIESFVASGGNYLGFCAGTYYASETISWAERATGENENSNQAKDYTAQNFSSALALLPGQAIGPFAWSAWKDGQRAEGLQPTEIDVGNSTMAAIGTPRFTKLFYYGGPFFIFPSPPKGLEVWARAIKPDSNSSSADLGQGMPTIVRFHFGGGNVILFSYHPVVLLKGSIYGVSLQKPLDMPITHTDPSPMTLDEVNLQSWNILHAALQITANQQPTPISILP